MKIIYIKLVNFIGIHSAMGLKEFEFSFDKIDKPIVQIYGQNRCGKTVLIQQLHPFSTINLNGDERSDLALIIPKEIGIKNIVYEVDGEVYDITHTYTPTRVGHSISSSIIHNGEELNPSGGVNLFNTLIERILGINKYVFSFIINGTNLTSFANMSTTQRKNLLNKALGIDIYDKIHKLATDDYRYTNKLITSLNNTKEYILSKYGSYENLCCERSTNRNIFEELTNSINDIEKRMNVIYGEINIINQQNPEQELSNINNQLSSYERVVSIMGSYDPDMYDRLVQDQIRINNELNDYKTERLMIRKDRDVLYEKKNDIQNTLYKSMRARGDYDNMLKIRDDTERKINEIVIDTDVSASSDYYRSLIQPAQAINDICTEITSCLNKNHLEMFCQMIINGIDVVSFLMQEGNILMDSEKEKSAVARIKRMVGSVEGDFVEKECAYSNCVYRKTYNMLDSFFNTYQSTTSSQFTEYDLEQIEHANKNVQTLKRLLGTEYPIELRDSFNLNNIMLNIQKNEFGISVSYIKYLMEEAARIEQRNRYISQLSDINKTIENMKTLLIPTDDIGDAVTLIDKQIDELTAKDSELTESINKCENELEQNDAKRLMLSQVKHLNISDLTKRRNILSNLINKLNTSKNEYQSLQITHNEMKMRLNEVNITLKTVEDAYTQYNNTVTEINKHDTANGKYKIIAEATSSTKGKPVIAIRDTVNNALALTNRLLDIMYNGEIELLEPEIDESTFTLPFRCGSHTSPDIRYGSQSESTLLSLALEMALSASLSRYNVCLIDEIDAALDIDMCSLYVAMLYEVCSTLKIEQMFLISHHIDDSVSSCVYRMDLHQIINKSKE